jgi:hypothetical protein
MEKKLVVAAMLAVAFIGAIFIVISVLKKNEAVVYNENYIWHAEVDPSGFDMLVRGDQIDRIRKDVHKLINALNKTEKESESSRTEGDAMKTELPQVRLQKIEHRTADVEIVNDQYLTENMGSEGAQDYLAEVTFTLTENPDIAAVNFIFNAGDHAMPGLYTRESFASYKIMTGGGRKH